MCIRDRGVVKRPAFNIAAISNDDFVMHNFVLRHCANRDAGIDQKIHGRQKMCIRDSSYPEAYGLRHLAFAVDSVDNTVRELNKRGIDVYKRQTIVRSHDCNL